MLKLLTCGVITLAHCVEEEQALCEGGWCFVSCAVQKKVADFQRVCEGVEGRFVESG